MATAPVPGPVPTAATEAARRTRERVLSAAGQAFAAEGGSVSLDRIARLAGLGAGTVHRHFPTKESLLEAVLARRLDALVARARWWADAAEPGPALLGWLTEVAGTAAGHKGLCDAVQGDGSWTRIAFTAAGRRFDQALVRLLRQAQRAGAVRGEVTAAEVTTLIVGCSVMVRRDRDGALVRRVLGTLAPADGTVTELHPAAGFRDEAVCAVCGAELRAAPTGRPARYCGAACRQRAHRRRVAAPA
jgi:AcrR family transcriptional regulator